MSRYSRPEWRAIRIPIRSIEHVYGDGNLDDAGDDLVYALRLVSDYPDQFRYRFDLDSAHPNPWYHSMVLEVEGISDSAYARFLAKVAALGLAKASGSG
jgi:hypothetical protein